MKQYLKSLEHTEIKGPRIRVINIVILTLVVAIMAVFIFMAQYTARINEAQDALVEKSVESELAANALQHASDRLTAEARLFAVTGNASHLDSYFEEIDSRRRENAVATLREVLGASEASRELEEAQLYSEKLKSAELKAFALTCAALGLEPRAELPALTPEDAALTPEEKQAGAFSLLYGEQYDAYDRKIDECVENCLTVLSGARVEAQRTSTAAITRLLRGQQLLAALLAAVVVAAVAVVTIFILRPLSDSIGYIIENEKLPMRGAFEVQYLAKAYNLIFTQNRANEDSLKYEAEHDPLTGLYNRGAFERLREQTGNEDTALLLVDVDYFKTINDTYGHDAGDQILKKVASSLGRSFRTTDYCCRVGGDEFAVIMTSITPELRDVVLDKLRRVISSEQGSRRASDDALPRVTLSIGCAFSAQRTSEADDLYKMADSALYVVKENGKNGVAIYGEDRPVLMG